VFAVLNFQRTKALTGLDRVERTFAWAAVLTAPIFCLGTVGVSNLMLGDSNRTMVMLRGNGLVAKWAISKPRNTNALTLVFARPAAVLLELADVTYDRWAYVAVHRVRSSQFEERQPGPASKGAAAIVDRLTVNAKLRDAFSPVQTAGTFSQRLLM